MKKFKTKKLYKNYLQLIRKKDMIFLRYILIIPNHIFFVKLNENNFYMKIVDLDKIYNFLVLSFFHLKSLRC